MLQRRFEFVLFRFDKTSLLLLTTTTVVAVACFVLLMVVEAVPSPS
jgi:hypothetical protein